MSDPLSALFLPIVLVRLATLRRRRHVVTPLLYLASLAVQLSVTLQTHLTSSGERPTVNALARSTGFRVFLYALVGQSKAAGLYRDLHNIPLVAAVLFAVAIVLWTALRNRQLGALAMVSLIAGVGFFVIAVWIRWLPVYDPAVSVSPGASRYSVVPVSLLIIAFGAALETWLQRHATARRAVRIGALAVPAALLLVIAIPVFGASTRYTAVSWPTEITDAASHCAAARPSHTEVLSIAPDGWTLSLTCAELEHH